MVANIWDTRSVPDEQQSKASTSYSRWRYLVGLQLGEMIGDQDRAFQIIHEYGILQLGIDYDDLVTVEQMVEKLKDHQS